MEDTKALWAKREDGIVIEGVEMKVGGMVLIVPPLSLGWVRTNKATIKAIIAKADATPAEQFEIIDTMMEVMHVALRRNYPNVTLEAVADVVDMRVMDDVMLAVMGQTEELKKRLARLGESQPGA